MTANLYFTSTTNTNLFKESEMRDEFYPRPEGALILSDIKKDMTAYHVYGYFGAEGKISSEFLILSEPLPYCETEDAKRGFSKKNLEKNQFFLNLIILVKETYLNLDGLSKALDPRPAFVDDLSLIEEKRFNNNFIFANKDLAQKYADYVRSKLL